MFHILILFPTTRSMTRYQRLPTQALFGSYEGMDEWFTV
jgi:hypothetical protein